jgi:predicted acetyltransferase
VRELTCATNLTRVAHLQLPDVSFHQSFLAAVAEEPGATRLPGGEERALGDPRAFEVYVARLLSDRLPNAPRPTGTVACTALWWVDGDRYLGRVHIRHGLTDWLRTYGGHVGYWIRPSSRGLGHGTAAFRASLPYAAELGLDPVLLTCDYDNEPSRRIIEGAGGIFENRIELKLRYWVPTGEPAETAAGSARLPRRR